LIADAEGVLPAARIALPLLLSAAAVVDVRQLRIPNALSLGGALLGLALWTSHAGVSGLLGGIGGMLLGAVVFLPFYLMKGMGAGDVKLMGAVGAFLGPFHAFLAAITVALFGGAIAAWEALQQGRLWAALVDAMRILTGRRPNKKVGTARPEEVTPYGLAIAGGTLLYMVVCFTG
jgi:prepilin peptidase CpaA